ncbi:MAG: aldehyde dehydrogenase family protein [Bacteroidia bacterium]|nr:aldehyde dehydrogenase family protein [Bacteroidia bacterium]
MSISHLFQEQQKHRTAVRNTTVSERSALLKKLEKELLNRRTDLQKALFTDFRKPAMEADITELWVVLAEIRHIRKNLRNWMRPVKADIPLAMLGTSAETVFEGKGTCLILSPWNYPVNLTFGPLALCLAAGNNAIIKPSEFTPATAALMKSIIEKVFEPRHVTLVEGDKSVATELLTLPFDHIFFTGSPKIGRVVMEAAAKNLTSVTLELGGKSPVYIHADADVKDAASKIIAAKMVNAGQSCIAPDYLLVHKAIKEPLLRELHAAARNFYDPSQSANNQDYASIVSDSHFQRQLTLAGKPELTAEQNELRILPLTFNECSGLNVPLMQEEIFGPIMPFQIVSSEAEAISIMNTLDEPLSIYVFTKSGDVKKQFRKQTKSGSLCYNECAVQFLNPALPFGGIKNSGIGRSHGKAGFQAFSNERVYFKQRIGFTTAKLLYPPYNKWKQRLVTLLLKYF